jgi:hypothetical protein
MSITIPKMPEPICRPTTEDFRELVRWGLKQGLLRWPVPPIEPIAKDISPDLRAVMREKDRQMREELGR